MLTPLTGALTAPGQLYWRVEAAGGQRLRCSEVPWRGGLYHEGAESLSIEKSRQVARVEGLRASGRPS